MQLIFETRSFQAASSLDMPGWRYENAGRSGGPVYRFDVCLREIIALEKKRFASTGLKGCNGTDESFLTYLGLAISTASLASLALLAAIFVFYNYIAGYEERILEEKFGNNCRTYMKKTGKWIPHIY